MLCVIQSLFLLLRSGRHWNKRHDASICVHNISKPNPQLRFPSAKKYLNSFAEHAFPISWDQKLVKKLKKMLRYRMIWFHAGCGFSWLIWKNISVIMEQFIVIKVNYWLHDPNANFVINVSGPAIAKMPSNTNISRIITIVNRICLCWKLPRAEDSQYSWSCLIRCFLPAVGYYYFTILLLKVPGHDSSFHILQIHKASVVNQTIPFGKLSGSIPSCNLSFHSIVSISLYFLHMSISLWAQVGIAPVRILMADQQKPENNSWTSSITRIFRGGFEGTPLPWTKLLPVMLLISCESFNGNAIFAYVGMYFKGLFKAFQKTKVQIC